MRHSRLLIALAFAGAISACGGGTDSTAPQVTINGIYNLQSVNGTHLPYAFVINGVPVTEVSDVITASGGSFTQLTTVDITQNGTTQRQTISDAGTYSLNGTAASFTFNSDGSTGTATATSNSFTVADNGYSYYYVKQ